jgi:hypothetical protein
MKQQFTSTYEEMSINAIVESRQSAAQQPSSLQDKLR